MDMASFEESRYIANTVIPDQVDSAVGEAGSAADTVPLFVWVVIIAVLGGIIAKIIIQHKKVARILGEHVGLVQKIARAQSGMEIEKVFSEVCAVAGAEHLAMYVKRGEWYGLSFESHTGTNQKNSSIPLLLSPSEAVAEGGKSGNFVITPVVCTDEKSIARFYTRSVSLDKGSELFERVQTLCENGMKIHDLLSSGLSSERQSKIANITSKLSSSFLSWQYDRERLFFFISNIIIKSVSAVEVVITDEKNHLNYHYGKKFSVGTEKEFYIHHSGCKMKVITSSPLESLQINTIGKFVDSSYSLFIHEEENVKYAEQFFEFLIHSNEAMELEFTYFNHHSDMVATVAVELAKSLQMDAFTIQIIEMAAKIHDIGMIADVSFSLDKQDKLTEKELDTIRNHPLYGSIIVEPFNQIYPIGNLIKCHHERYDGQGYPLGLLGDEVPLEAYILGFSEHFVGLISDRSYRQGHPFDKACDEVRKLSGQAFNPIVVLAFEQQAEEIFRELTQYKPNLIR